VDLRGETSVRESVALLRHALAFVGVVSFLAHATNATGTPAVVLFGPSAPNVWAHPNQMVINKSLRCAPCIDTLAGHPCPYVSVRCALSRRPFRCRSGRGVAGAVDVESNRTEIVGCRGACLVNTLEARP
jgi:hypothetical protein